MRRVRFLCMLFAVACSSTEPYRRLAAELSGPFRGAPRRLAVLPFQGSDPSLQREGEAAAERLLTRLYGRKGVELVERSRLQQVLSEARLGQTGALDESQVRRLGRLLGAEGLVVGTVLRGAKGLEVAARVVDVETGRLLAAASAVVAPAPAAPAPESASRRVAIPVAPTPPAPEPAVAPGGDLGDGDRLPWFVASHGVAADSRRLYVVGGFTPKMRGSARGVATVLSAPVLAKGGLGRWRMEQPMPAGRYQVGAAVVGDWIFAVGGYDSYPRSEVYIARLGDEGRVGGWRLAGQLPYGCTAPAVAATGAWLYVAGCSAQLGASGEFLAASVGRDGTLGGWRRGAMTEAVGSPAIAVADGRVWLAGGSRHDGAFSDTVVSIDVADGEPAAATAARRLPTGLTGFPMAVHDGRLWVFGGVRSIVRDGRPEHKDSDEVYSAVIGPRGELGPWLLAPRRLRPATRVSAAPVVGKVSYRVGGESDAVLRDEVSVYPLE